MSEPRCPNCGSNFLVVERRPDGNARCACGWSGKYELCFEAPKKSDCVTHHHACDCREEKFKQLEAQLKEAHDCLLLIRGRARVARYADDHEPLLFRIIEDVTNYVTSYMDFKKRKEKK